MVQVITSLQFLTIVGGLEQGEQSSLLFKYVVWCYTVYHMYSEDDQLGFLILSSRFIWMGGGGFIIVFDKDKVPNIPHAW